MRQPHNEYRSGNNFIFGNKEDVADFHGCGWGSDYNHLTKEELQALIDGKTITWFDGEYTHSLDVKEQDNG